MDITPESTPTKRTRAKPAAKTAKLKAATKTKVKAKAEAAAASKKPRAVRKTTAPVLSHEEVDSMIATAAYYLAAARNFSPGRELDDWLEAERNIRSQVFG